MPSSQSENYRARNTGLNNLFIFHTISPVREARENMGNLESQTVDLTLCRFQSAEAEEERAPARQVDVRQAAGTGGYCC